jgi:hypothetical protein
VAATAELEQSFGITAIVLPNDGVGTDAVFRAQGLPLDVEDAVPLQGEAGRRRAAATLRPPSQGGGAALTVPTFWSVPSQTNWPCSPTGKWSLQPAQYVPP